METPFPLIGFFCDTPMVGSGYLAMLQTGLLAGCRKWNCLLVIASFELHDADMPARVAEIVRHVPLCGVVLPEPMCDMPGLLGVLQAAGLPVVRIAPHTEDATTFDICIDNEQAAYDVMQHLVGLGHKRIAFIKGPPDHGDANARYAGFRKAMKAAGLPIEEALCVQSATFDYSSGTIAADELLARRPLPTAVFACNDEIAAAVLEAARRRGIKIPEDLSIAGFDDAPLARLVLPTLTTCRQRMELIGYTAVDFIVNPPILGDVRQRIQPHELVVRESTARAPDSVTGHEPPSNSPL
jgi:LacI family transcriptional regulator